MSRAKARVLIVDDDPDILFFLRVDLEAEGFDVSLASDGETALRRIEEEHPDLVLLDVMMPVLDGWATLEGITAQPRRPRVVILSAKSSPQDKERAARLGADRYVTKPFAPRDVVEAIRAAMAPSQPA
ncbi:MAG: response regulator [Actinomycetota bacterium]|nr:response regulator [Actinomycetota bacterium]